MFLFFLICVHIIFHYNNNNRAIRDVVTFSLITSVLLVPDQLPSQDFRNGSSMTLLTTGSGYRLEEPRHDFWTDALLLRGFFVPSGSIMLERI